MRPFLRYLGDVKVYILSTYEEHGSDSVVATTQHDRLGQLMADNFEGFAPLDEELKALERLKDQGWPISTQGHDLSNGWGGILLHIVELK